MFLSVFRKWLLFFFVSALGGGYLFAGGLSDFPEVFVASYDAGNGIARLVVDWNKVPSDDERQFGLYRSVGKNAYKYDLVTTLNPNVSMYTDCGLNVDTEYHYIIEGALPRKTLPETKPRGKKEQRTERTAPRATLSYGNAPGSPIAWVPPEESSGEPLANADTVTGDIPPPPQLQPRPDNSPLPAAQPNDNVNRLPDIASAPSALPPYEPTVPERGAARGNSGVIFTMGYFSNRVFQLTGQTNGPALVSLTDNNAKSRLLSLFRQSYARSSFPGTSLYYALHHAVNQIDRWDADGALSGFDTVLLVTITDGLDTSSTDPALAPIDGVAFNNALHYQHFIRNIIEGRQAGAKKITAVSIGIRGTDLLSEDEYTTTLRSVANADDNVYRIPLHNLTKTLQDIAASATGGMEAHPFGFITPAYPDGTEIFIALDGFSTPPRGQNFIAGQVKVRGEQFTLENITLGGFAQETVPFPAASVTGRTEPNGAVEWLFNFSEPLNPSRVIHFYKPGKDWRSSKEFALRVYPPVDTRRSALVYLLVDNSFSMSNQNIAAIRDSAAKFIEALSVIPASVQPAFSGDQSFVMTRLPERTVGPELAAAPPPPAHNAAEPARSVTETQPAPPPPGEPPAGEPPAVPQPSPASASEPPAASQPAPASASEPPAASQPASASASEPPAASQPASASASEPPAASQPAPAPLGDSPALPAVLQPASGNKGYWVQASSSENRNVAEEIIAQLRQYQLVPVITEAQIRGKTFYRVRIGPYATLADASAVADFVKTPPLGFYDSFIP
jgi:cell division protein FtsN